MANVEASYKATVTKWNNDFEHATWLCTAVALLSIDELRCDKKNVAPNKKNARTRAPRQKPQQRQVLCVSSCFVSEIIIYKEEKFRTGAPCRDATRNKTKKLNCARYL